MQGLCRRHHRPETAAGTLVFCPCGEGNRVPWESTVAPEPEEAAEPAEAPAAAPAEEAPPRAPDEEAPPGPRRRRAAERRDPSRCFNHPDVPSVRTCAACGEHFCNNCVVTLRDRTLCGPCKNFAVRSLQRSAGVSSLSIVSLCVGLLSSPVAVCPTLAAMGGQPGGSPAMFVAALLGLVAPLAAVAAGLKALDDIDRKPRLGGQAMAISGMVTGGASLLWCLTLLLILAVRAAQGE